MAVAIEMIPEALSHHSFTGTSTHTALPRAGLTSDIAPHAMLTTIIFGSRQPWKINSPGPLLHRNKS
jgi:hypothetical protein